MLAANSKEAVLGRHESISCTLERPFAGDFSFYCDREIYLEADQDKAFVVENGEVWYDLNPGGEEKKPATSFYAMPDAERDDAPNGVRGSVPIFLFTSLFFNEIEKEL